MELQRLDGGREDELQGERLRRNRGNAPVIERRLQAASAAWGEARLLSFSAEKNGKRLRGVPMNAVGSEERKKKTSRTPCTG